MTGQLLTVAPPALDANADPYSGAKWYFYQSGTTTPIAVYADATLTTSLGSVVMADSAGRFVPIYLDPQSLYRAVLKNSTGSATVSDIDPVNTDMISQLASNGGAGLIGFSHANSYPPGTIGASLQKIVFVTDPPFNAKGDGSTDDAAAFNAAFTYLHSIGGGMLNVPAGDYYLGSTIKLGAHTSLICSPGVTFYKGHDASFLNNGLGYTTSSDVPAYGGHGDIVINGGIWEGFAGDEIYDSFTHFALGYGKSIIVRNAVLKDGIGGGHFVDMSCCDMVLFEDCQFLGFSLNTGASSSSDVIQLDHNVEGSFPYFGLPKFKQNRNITVRRCYFGPNPANTDSRFGSFYSGIGAHGSVQDQWPENIWIENCIFDAPQYAGVRVWKWKNAHIVGNIFKNSGDDGRGIHITATPAGSASSMNIDRVQTNQAQAADGIYITENTFEDMGATGILLTEITFGTNSSIRHNNIIIHGNKFINSSAFQSLDIRDARGVVVSSNTFKDVCRFAYIGGTSVEDITITYNVLDGCSDTTYACTISAALDFTVSGNVFKNLAARGFSISGAAKRGMFKSNVMTDFGLTGNFAGVSMSSNCEDISISGNGFFRVASTNTSEDIVITSTCARCDVLDNSSNTGNIPTLHQSPGGIARFRYSGSPEGAITARPGSECNDITNGVKYVKKSGSGSTGWKLVTQAA